MREITRPDGGIQHQLFAAPLVSSIPGYEAKGVVYTKRWVVDLLLDLSGYTVEADLSQTIAVEPSAGNGAFLGPMIERLIESCRTHDRQIAECEEALVAYELDDLSATRARAIAFRMLQERNVPDPIAQRLSHSWVRTGDYLLTPNWIDADFIIGNPPYVRLKDIPEPTATLYRKMYPTMRGRADLYVAFYEAALRQLKPGGVCAFICADR